MASSRYSGHSTSSSSRVPLGAREDALHRAVHDPKFFPALEGLANAVIGQDLNSVCSKEVSGDAQCIWLVCAYVLRVMGFCWRVGALLQELEQYREELLRLGEEMVG